MDGYVFVLWVCMRIVMVVCGCLLFSWGFGGCDWIGVCFVLLWVCWVRMWYCWWYGLVDGMVVYGG